MKGTLKPPGSGCGLPYGKSQPRSHEGPCEAIFEVHVALQSGLQLINRPPIRFFYCYELFYIPCRRVRFQASVVWICDIFRRRAAHRLYFGGSPRPSGARRLLPVDVKPAIPRAIKDTRTLEWKRPLAFLSSVTSPRSKPRLSKPRRISGSFSTAGRWVQANPIGYAGRVSIGSSRWQTRLTSRASGQGSSAKTIQG